MIKRFAGAAAALVASVLSTAPTMAWDSFGHMEVAAVTWDQMTPNGRICRCRTSEGRRIPRIDHR